MTRIVGELQGPEGPLEGRLFVKPSSPFIGAPADGTSFRIENGIVDIELAANVGGTVWLVDWKDKFDLSPVTYIERWRVPHGEAVPLEEVRGMGGAVKQPPTSRTAILDATLWRQQAQEAEAKLQSFIDEKAELLLQISNAESRVAAEAGKVASLNAEIGSLKQKLAAKPETKQVEVETVIERQLLPEEAQILIAEEKQRATLLEQELQEAKASLEERLSLATHFSSLHAEIDRLKRENQQLQLRIEELKQPIRNVSSLRRMAVENLDRLTGG